MYDFDPRCSERLGGTPDAPTNTRSGGHKALSEDSHTRNPRGTAVGDRIECRSGVCALLCCAIVHRSAVSFTAAYSSSPLWLPMLARAVSVR